MNIATIFSEMQTISMNAMKHHMANMMTPSLQTAMNQLSNHDHSRFLTRTNHKVGRVGQLGSQCGRRRGKPCSYAGSESSCR